MTPSGVLREGELHRGRAERATHMMCTMAPQPLMASRSTADSRHWDSTSNSSSGSWSSQSVTPTTTAICIPCLGGKGTRTCRVGWTCRFRRPRNRFRRPEPLSSPCPRETACCLPSTLRPLAHRTKGQIYTILYITQLGSDLFLVYSYLFSYRSVDNKAEKASGFISRFSLNLYILQRNCNNWSTESISVASPVSPTYNLSVILNTYKLRSKIFRFTNILNITPSWNLVILFEIGLLVEDHYNFQYVNQK